MTRPIRKLAIVGASARAAAFSAIRAGYEVVAADLFADADLARVAPVTRINGYPDGLADWLAATECDAWMYTGALENYPELVDRMASLRPLLGNSGGALRCVRDPLALQDACREAGVAFPETRPAADGLPLDGSWLCKTYRGASGSGTWRLDGAEALTSAEAERAVFQKFIPGVSCAAIVAASNDGALLLGVTRQLLSDDVEKPWQYVGSIGPLPVAVALHHQIAKLGEAISKAFCLRGLIGFDLVISGGCPWVIEVNPRYTASVEVLERATSAAYLQMHSAGCQDALAMDATSATAAIPPAAMTPVHGKAIVFASQSEHILPSFFDWATELATRDAHPILADIPHPGELIAAGRPMLTVFASGQTVEDCRSRLQRQVAMVESRPFGWTSET